ncbi:MAG: SDR family oxidoreductase [Chloroflexota bacterium]|nr:SDR family oxidoreductase [Chloroflexota bacterium]
MTYLITGGAGFIGSNIAAELVHRGERARVLDNLSTGKRENLAPLLGEVEFVEGDLRDLETVRQAVEGVDYVLHQGALPSVQRSIEDPLTTNEVNARGTLNLLIAARDAGVKRVVYASSSSIYGDSPVLPKTGEMRPAPKSPYAASKLAGEHYCQAFYQVYGLETVILRYFNVFGPNQDPTSEYAAVIPKFVTAMLQDERPVIYGDGFQSRDFTYVTNVVQANLLAAQAEGVAGEVLNIACGKRYNLLELVQAINRILGTSLTPIHTAPRPGDVRHSQADISKAEGMLGYRVEVAFEEGLRETIEWHRQRS